MRVRCCVDSQIFINFGEYKIILAMSGKPRVFSHSIVSVELSFSLTNVIVVPTLYIKLNNAVGQSEEGKEEEGN